MQVLKALVKNPLSLAGLIVLLLLLNHLQRNIPSAPPRGSTTFTMVSSGALGQLSLRV